MFDIGFFELIIILGIAVMVVGPKNLPRLARSVGRGWGEFVKTFEDLKQEVLNEADNLKEDVNMDQLEQDISSATKVEVDVNLDADKPADLQ